MIMQIQAEKEHKAKPHLSLFFSKFTKEYAIVIAIVALGVIFTFSSQYFLTFGNLRNIIQQSATVGIVAIGQALLLLCGDLDLSLGQNVCVTGCLAAWLMKFGGVNPWIAILIAIIFGCAIGTFNGLLSAYGKIPVFVVTLGVQLILKGLAKIITNATPIPNMPDDIKFLGRGFIFGEEYGIPISIILMLVLYFVFMFIARRTRLGRSIYAIGGGREAAYFAGINVRKIRTIAFIIAGGLSAFSGIILISRLDSASVTNGNLYEFDTIIASVIGGISIAGGKGKIVQALLGTLFLTLFFNGMNLINVHPFIQDVLKGSVLILAVTLDVIRNKRN